MTEPHGQMSPPNAPPVPTSTEPVGHASGPDVFVRYPEFAAVCDELWRLRHEIIGIHTIEQLADLRARMLHEIETNP